MLMNWPPTFSPADSGWARLMAGAPTAEMFCRMSATDWKPCFSMSARLMVSTGAAFSTSTWRMREPVTSIRSKVVVSVVPDSCANTVPVPTADTAPTASANEIASRSFVVLQFILSLSRKGYPKVSLEAVKKGDHETRGCPDTSRLLTIIKPT